MKISFLSLLILLSFIACESGAVKEKVNETPQMSVPAAVLDNFQKTYPSVVNSDWSISDNGWHQATFEMDKVPHHASFHPSGVWMETRSNMLLSNLPPTVKTTIEEQYQGYEIAETTLVTHHKKGLIYDVAFKNNKERMYVEFNKYGKAIKMSKGEL